MWLRCAVYQYYLKRAQTTLERMTNPSKFSILCARERQSPEIQNDDLSPRLISKLKFVRALSMLRMEPRSPAQTVSPSFDNIRICDAPTAESIMYYLLS